MAVYQFERSQKINATVDQVWDFISSPQNLKTITPDYMGFNITSRNLPEKMYPGMIISYIVRPLLGIPLKWVTEITHVIDQEYFVDEQRFGPYVMWHHQHHIQQIEGGVYMKDIVTYQPPFGILGTIMNHLLIRHQLKAIFEYRTKAIEEKFGKFSLDKLPIST